MGVTIKCKKTGQGIDMGAGGFEHLRCKVSELCGEPWKSHYETLVGPPRYSKDDAFYAQFNETTERLLAEKRISIKVVDFLLQPDVEGRIRYGACKQLLEIIGDYDDDILYGYAGRPDCARFRDFKELLRQCAEHKCDLVWR